ncbi:MAG: hypothetical protein ACFFCS_06655 [Candidatus Hodarchaeota archaeon]
MMEKNVLENGEDVLKITKLEQILISKKVPLKHVNKYLLPDGSFFGNYNPRSLKEFVFQHLVPHHRDLRNKELGRLSMISMVINIPFGAFIEIKKLLFETNESGGWKPKKFENISHNLKCPIDYEHEFGKVEDIEKVQEIIARYNFHYEPETNSFSTLGIADIFTDILGMKNYSYFEGISINPSKGYSIPMVTKDVLDNWELEKFRIKTDLGYKRALTRKEKKLFRDAFQRIILDPLSHIYLPRTTFIAPMLLVNTELNILRICFQGAINEAIAQHHLTKNLKLQGVYCTNIILSEFTSSNQFTNGDACLLLIDQDKGNLNNYSPVEIKGITPKTLESSPGEVPKSVFTHIYDVTQQKNPNGSSQILEKLYIVLPKDTFDSLYKDNIHNLFKVLFLDGGKEQFGWADPKLENNVNSRHNLQRLNKLPSGTGRMVFYEDGSIDVNKRIKPGIGIWKCQENVNKYVIFQFSHIEAINTRFNLIIKAGMIEEDTNGDPVFNKGVPSWVDENGNSIQESALIFNSITGKEKPIIVEILPIPVTSLRTKKLAQAFALSMIKRSRRLTHSNNKIRIAGSWARLICQDYSLIRSVYFRGIAFHYMPNLNSLFYNKGLSDAFKVARLLYDGGIPLISNPLLVQKFGMKTAQAAKVIQRLKLYGKRIESVGLLKLKYKGTPYSYGMEIYAPNTPMGLLVGRWSFILIKNEMQNWIENNTKKAEDLASDITGKTLKNKFLNTLKEMYGDKRNTRLVLSINLLDMILREWIRVYQKISKYIPEKYFNIDGVFDLLFLFNNLFLDEIEGQSSSDLAVAELSRNVYRLTDLGHVIINRWINIQKVLFKSQIAPYVLQYEGYAHSRAINLSWQFANYEELVSYMFKALRKTWEPLNTWDKFYLSFIDGTTAQADFNWLMFKYEMIVHDSFKFGKFDYFFLSPYWNVEDEEYKLIARLDETDDSLLYKGLLLLSHSNLYGTDFWDLIKKGDIIENRIKSSRFVDPRDQLPDWNC